jgi:SAM-dependent methyltransferase
MNRGADLLETWGQAAVLASAAAAGLLVELLRCPGSAEAHAARLGLAEGPARLTLEALVALGLAERRGTGYAGSPALAELDAVSPGGVAALSALWGHLPEYLRSGRPLVTMNADAASREQSYRPVVSGLGSLFGPAADAVAERLGPSERVLDVGAGSGVWSLAMAARHPGTRVTALELPEVMPRFLERAEALGLRERTEALPGDYFGVALPEGAFDRVVVANVLHLEPAERAAALVRRLAPAIRPGGELVAIGFTADGSDSEVCSGRVYALHLSMRTVGGRNHPRADVEAWCRQAGLSVEAAFGAGPAPRGLGAVVARRPA